MLKRMTAFVFVLAIFILPCLAEDAKDVVEAVKIYRKAAEQGDAAAQCNLGFAYKYGEGVNKDEAEAIKWFKKSAEQGDVDAQNALGFAYWHGEGVTKDDVEAIMWYRKAAEKGDAAAQNALGLVYTKRHGVYKDVAAAIKWFRKAAEQGDADAQYNLGLEYMFRGGLVVLSPLDAGAQFKLAFSHFKGQGTTKDEAEAIKWFQKSAEQGNADAKEALRELGVGRVINASEKPMSQWDGKESCVDYAKRVGLESTLTLDFGVDEKMEMVLIPAGKFLMGSPLTEELRVEDEPQHEVTITKPFYMGKYHVTVGQFRKFVAATMYLTEAEKDGKGWVWNGTKGEERLGASWKNSGFNQADDHPVVLISWNDAREFVKWVGGQTGKAVRLPTEAEWEYACRAGSKTEYCNGKGVEALKKVGWCSYDETLGGAGGTKHVGIFQPNAWGLYDMHGNAWQWCQDWYGGYSKESVVDPSGAANGVGHVLRGGSWFLSPARCRSASRVKLGLGGRGDDLGFRLVLVPAFRLP